MKESFYEKVTMLVKIWLYKLDHQTIVSDTRLDDPWYQNYVENALMPDIKTKGMMRPIPVVIRNQRAIMLEGSLRFEACRRLGHDMIFCEIHKMTDEQMRETILIGSHTIIKADPEITKLAKKKLPKDTVPLLMYEIMPNKLTDGYSKLKALNDSCDAPISLPRKETHL